MLLKPPLPVPVVIPLPLLLLGLKPYKLQLDLLLVAALLLSLLQLEHHKTYNRLVASPGSDALASMASASPIGISNLTCKRKAEELCNRYIK